MKYVRMSYPHGAVLLEVLLSVIILSVGMTGVIRSFFIGIQGRVQAQEYMAAAVLLDNKLTELLAARYFDQDTAVSGEFKDLFSGYRYEISAEPVEASDSLKKIRVEIFWPGREQERSLSAETYLFSRGITQE